MEVWFNKASLDWTSLLRLVQSGHVNYSILVPECNPVYLGVLSAEAVFVGFVAPQEVEFGTAVSDGKFYRLSRQHHAQAQTAKCFGVQAGIVDPDAVFVVEVEEGGGLLAIDLAEYQLERAGCQGGLGDVVKDGATAVIQPITFLKSAALQQA